MSNVLGELNNVIGGTKHWVLYAVIAFFVGFFLHSILKHGVCQVVEGQCGPDGNQKCSNPEDKKNCLQGMKHNNVYHICPSSKNCKQCIQDKIQAASHEANIKKCESSSWQKGFEGLNALKNNICDTGSSPPPPAASPPPDGF